MKCVVLGGGGFLGSWVSDCLLSDGHHVRIFDRSNLPLYRSFGKGELVEWMVGDFSNAHDIRTALEGQDAVVHLISSTQPKSSNDDPEHDVRTNLLGTLQLLEAMRVTGIRKIVFVSSGGTVYGSPVAIPVSELHPTDPNVSYGIVKLAIEKYLLMYQRLYGIQPVILRVANPFGERQPVVGGQGAVGVFLDRMLKGKVIEIWGDGEAMRDYIYVGDVAEAFAAALRYQGKHKIFNISSGVGTSLNQLVGILSRVVGVPPLCQYHPARGFDVPVSVLDNTLAAQELGWFPRISLTEGVMRTMTWLCSSHVPDLNLRTLD